MFSVMSPAFSAVVPETHGEPSSEAAVPRTRFSQTLELPPVLIGASESARQRAYSREAWSSRPSSGPLDSHGPNDSVGGTSKQARSSAFTVAKSDEKGKELRERLAFTEAIEPGMQDYLLDSCAEGMNGWLKAGQTIGLILSLLVLLPALSFFPALIPFPKPDAGFRENWRFNFITHPILNYVCSRAALELFARSTEPSQRYRVRWIVIGIPFVGVLACLLIHIVASSFGLYPVPYAAVSSCIPSIILCVMVASRLIPADLRTSEVRMFRNFNLVCWVSWAFQFGVLMLWLLAFPVLSPGWQLVGSFMVTTMLAGVGFAQERLGRWMGLPWYIATEVKVFILFIAFLFTAALLSAAKSITILIAMAIQDAGKALAIFGNMCFHLVSLCEAESRDEEQATEADGRDPACGACCKQMQLVSSGQFLTSARQKWSTALALRRRLREIFSRCEIQTREGLQATTLPVADVRLLSHFTRCLNLTWQGPGILIRAMLGCILADPSRVVGEAKDM